MIMIFYPVFDYFEKSICNYFFFRFKIAALFEVIPNSRIFSTIIFLDVSGSFIVFAILNAKSALCIKTCLL